MENSITTCEEFQKFKDINITLLEPYKGYKAKILMKCDICGNEALSTPQVRLQGFRKYGTNGCKTCHEKNKYTKEREQVFDIIKSHNITILTESYNGNQSSTEMITVRNNNCGHTFDITPNNLLFKTKCPVCGIEQRKQSLKQFKDQ